MTIGQSVKTRRCPRFHTDNVTIRLITTYYGLAAEWLPDQSANRAALGTVFASQINTPGAIPRVKKVLNT